MKLRNDDILDAEVLLIHRAIWGSGVVSAQTRELYKKAHTLHPSLMIRWTMSTLRWGFLLSSLEFFFRFLDANNALTLKFKIASYVYEVDPQFSARFAQQKNHSYIILWVNFFWFGLICTVKMLTGAVVYLYHRNEIKRAYDL